MRWELRWQHVQDSVQAETRSRLAVRRQVQRISSQGKCSTVEHFEISAVPANPYRAGAQFEPCRRRVKSYLRNSTDNAEATPPSAKIIPKYQ